VPTEKNKQQQQLKDKQSKADKYGIFQHFATDVGLMKILQKKDEEIWEKTSMKKKKKNKFFCQRSYR